MVELARQRFDYSEYLLLEEVATVKHEFLDGHVWAMAGGSPEHAAVCSNVTALLHTSLRGRPCRVYSSDLRIRVRATGLGTYPDITVVCGQLERDPDDGKGHTVVNPRLLVEVLSPSTQEYDRGEKLEHYKTIASLGEVVLVAHDRRQVEVYRREPDGAWSRHVAVDDETLRLTSLDCDLSLADVYRDPLA